MVGDARYDTAEAINDGSGRNAEVVKIMEKQFLTQDWSYWEPIFQEKEIPYQRLFRPEDVLKDEEAYANDILRPLEYDAFGTKVLPTSPIRFDSMGDPVLYKSRPIGYDTARIMREYGYADEDIARLDGSAVVCYDGPDLPESALKPSFGPRSRKER